MSDPVSTPTPRNPERWKTAALMLTIATTVFASILAALQTDADIRSSTANRDSQYLAIAGSGELQRAGLVGNYEFALLGDLFKDMQVGTVYELTALEQQSRGEDRLAEGTLVLAAAATARAERGRVLSILYSDPRYAPAEADSFPDAQAYLDDLSAPAKDLVSRQNAAADLYQRWSVKSDAYVTVLTVLAVAFFLFGLAQTVQALQLQRFFVLSGLVILIGMLIWTAAILVS